MAWYYNSIRIYPQDLDRQVKQIIARLQPLSSGTVLQTFGYESLTIQVQCKVVGDTNRAALEACTTDHTAHTLAGNDGFSESVYLASAAFKRDLTAYQSIDPTQDCTTPVYTVSMEFYK